MLHARFGKGICDRFLVPYNEKLYACDLRTLDKDAMGRFFPHANLDEIIKNMKAPTDAGYNATFTYPEGGAIEYVKALASALDPKKISLHERLEAIDLKRRIATTTKRQIHFERLVSSAPFHHFVNMTGLPHDAGAFTWNKVLVFNLGFDKKGPKNVHWIYYPDRARSFYRVGFYDNIFDDERLSIYVELGFARDAHVDAKKELARVLADLEAEGVIGKGHKLLAQHSVVMDPASKRAASQRTSTPVERDDLRGDRSSGALRRQRVDPHRDRRASRRRACGRGALTRGVHHGLRVAERQLRSRAVR
jgi:protoporphyrinogen oxidase